MDRDTLVLGLAAVFAGISMLLVVLGFAYQLFFLLVAAPFILVTYLMWEHASGRFRERIRQSQTRRGRARGADDAARGPNDFRGFGPGRRSAADGAGAGGTGGPNGPGGAAGGGRQHGRRSRRNQGRQRWSGAAQEAQSSRLSSAEAYRTLGLSSSATAAEVKDAYRSKVKEAHPDTESGSQEEFKRVNRAYERLSE